MGLSEPDDESSLRAKMATRLGVTPASLPRVELRKRTVDARRGRVRFHVVVGFAPDAEPELALPHPVEVEGPVQVLIVGDGPAGLFCAYELARAGVRAQVVDRGKPVQPRRRDLRGLNQEGRVDPDSNYCFGEGGAGTYSDGKLYTRSHKRGDVRDVLEILALHGAPPEILVDGRPHIGSNRLPKVILAMRERLAGLGVEFRFGSRVVDLLCERRRVVGVKLADDAELTARAVVLATGHSARDVITILLNHGVRLEPKAFALGVRIEHPQPLIDEIQYGSHARHPRLGAAPYKLAEKVDGRGVFSFCMCPGGWIVPAATEPETVVVNGMSLSRRDSPFANSGLVVEIEPGDLHGHGFDGPTAGIEFQRAIERAAFQAGGGELRAPATRLTDFLENRGSTTVPRSSYVPGLSAGRVDEVLDSTGLLLSERIRRALPGFARKMRGYITEEAVLVGVESRTSSPVRVPRNENLESPDLAMLFPCGEGAGYAGGIVSAALDGMTVARQIARKLGDRSIS